MTGDKEYTIEWSKRLLSVDFIVLDTETTGLNKHDEIVQIGIIDNKNNILMDTFLKPSIPIPPDAIRVHGITSDMVKNAPAFISISKKLHNLIRSYHVVGYNASYDHNMINQCCNIYNLIPINGFWYDVMERYAAYYGEWNHYHNNYKWQKLTAACKQQGIEIKNKHSAVGDCKLTLELIKKMAGV